MEADVGATGPAEPSASLDPSLAAFLAESSSDDRPSWGELGVDDLRLQWASDLRLTSGSGDPSIRSRDLRVPTAAGHACG